MKKIKRVFDRIGYAYEMQSEKAKIAIMILFVVFYVFTLLIFNNWYYGL